MRRVPSQKGGRLAQDIVFRRQKVFCAAAAQHPGIFPLTAAHNPSVPIHRRGGSAIIAATIENKASTVRIHDDYCSETALSSLPLSEIISEAYRRRGKSARAVAGNQPPRSGAEAL